MLIGSNLKNFYQPRVKVKGYKVSGFKVLRSEFSAGAVRRFASGESSPVEWTSYSTGQAKVKDQSNKKSVWGSVLRVACYELRVKGLAG
jgi:hypothetical protein